MTVDISNTLKWPIKTNTSLVGQFWSDFGHPFLHCMRRVLEKVDLQFEIELTWTLLSEVVTFSVN